MIFEKILLLCVTSGMLAFNIPGNDNATTRLFKDGHFNSDTSKLGSVLKIDNYDLPILPPSSGVQFFRDGIVFLSSSKNEGEMASKHISFGSVDTYYAPLIDSAMGTHMIFMNSMPSLLPCDAFTFSRDYKTMYFIKHYNPDNCEKIFQARQINEDINGIQWSVDETPLSFCKETYIYTHPSLSSDGRLMIFSSDKTESAGGMDLFITRKNGETWSDPVNLGDSINTVSNEIYPFIDSENNLFFSSDRLKGNGGYDIYVCKFQDGTWGNPVNLSRTINTKYDDVAFKISRKDGNKAFYSVKHKSPGRPVQLVMIRKKRANFSENSANLSQIFTDPDIMISRLPEREVIVAREPEITVPEKTEPEVVKEPPVVPVTKEVPVETKKVEEPVKEKTIETKKADPPVLTATKDKVLYRVQFLSSDNPKGSYKFTLDGVVYNTYEYFYSGAYRTCIGEFDTVAAAKELQDKCREKGYSQAFVAAFKNNIRSKDPELFK